MPNQVGAGPTEVVGDALICCLFACKPLEVDAFGIVVDEFTQCQHGATLGLAAGLATGGQWTGRSRWPGRAGYRHPTSAARSRRADQDVSAWRFPAPAE